jgi:nucleoside-triphosphatase
LLLTGAPGTGKTTVMRRLAEQLGRKRIAGFFTEEMRTRGERRGFRLVAYDGAAAVIAHVDFPKTLRVSKYGIDVAAIDRAADAALAPPLSVELYLVDEIGKMECFSAVFVERMRRARERCAGDREHRAARRGIHRRSEGARGLRAMEADAGESRRDAG